MANDANLSLLRLKVAIVGAILLAVGAGLWWLPAGPMVGGAVLVLAAVVGELRAPLAPVPAEPPGKGA